MTTRPSSTGAVAGTSDSDHPAGRVPPGGRRTARRHRTMAATAFDARVSVKRRPCTSRVCRPAVSPPRSARSPVVAAIGSPRATPARGCGCAWACACRTSASRCLGCRDRGGLGRAAAALRAHGNHEPPRGDPGPRARRSSRRRRRLRQRGGEPPCQEWGRRRARDPRWAVAGRTTKRRPSADLRFAFGAPEIPRAEFALGRIDTAGFRPDVHFLWR